MEDAPKKAESGGAAPAAPGTGARAGGRFPPSTAWRGPAPARYRRRGGGFAGRPGARQRREQRPPRPPPLEGGGGGGRPTFAGGPAGQVEPREHTRRRPRPPPRSLPLGCHAFNLPKDE